MKENGKLIELLNSAIDYDNFFLKELSNSIDLIIQCKIVDDNIIVKMFDSLLSLVFVDEVELHNVYYKLLDYTNSFNSELCKDYESIFLEQFYETNKNILQKKYN